MTRAFRERQEFNAGLFGGEPSPGHGLRVIVAPPDPRGDMRALREGDVAERTALYERRYEFAVECAEKIDDDTVPAAHLWTGTSIFAAAFGCPVHNPDEGMPFALPLVDTPEAADRIEAPPIDTGPLGEVFEIADRLVERLGSETPLRVCDVQSPFDIAALIWEKTSFFSSLLTAPESIHRLVEKTCETLTRFLSAFVERYPGALLVHYPPLWMPARLGVCLSEDECGVLSPRQFGEFCQPYLVRLSEIFGGISLHSCAKSDHQWDHFAALPGLRYVNLHHPPTPLEKAVDLFSGRAVMVPGGRNGQPNIAAFARQCLDAATQESRFLFVAAAPDVERGQRAAEEIRSVIGR